MAASVLLAGYYGFNNLGDELLARSVIELLESCGLPREEIVLLSGDPPASELRHGVSCIDRWSISAVRAAMRTAKLLILGGGGLFQDVTSVKSCIYYWGLIRIARLERCKIAAFGQSVGPLQTPQGRFLAKNAFAACDLITVRDKASQDVLSRWGLNSNLAPDLVFGLDIPALEKPGSVVLVNSRPLANGLWSGEVARLAAELQSDGFRLRGIALAPEDEEELKKIGLPEVVTVGSLEEFLTASQDAVSALGVRLHFGVLSFCRGLNTVLAPYDPKVEGFAAAWQISLLSVGDKKADSAIMPLLRGSARPEGHGSDVRRGASELRKSFGAAVRLLLEG